MSLFSIISLMKLYRSLKQPFVLENETSQHHSLKLTLLQKRAQGDFAYPEALNSPIIERHKSWADRFQYFTDNKEIAQKYGSYILEIDVTPEELIEHFIVEIQHYTNRKKDFQLVYVIDPKTLAKNIDKWMAS